MISKVYSDGNIQFQIKKEFNSKAPEHAVLQEFLDGKEYLVLQQELKEANHRNVRIADRYSYSVVDSKRAIDIFNSEEFLEFLSRIIGRKMTKINLEAKEFKWKNYTLLHDSEGKEEMRFFFFIPSVNEWDYFWGGSKVYHLDGGKGKNLVFTPKENTLCLIHKRKDDLYFTQYINHYIGNEKVVVIEGTVS